MREIRYRGKRLDNGMWIEGSLWMYLGEPNILTEVNIVGYKVYPETVGQYTGLRDRNGNRIFEGDIVKDASIGMLGDVVFSITGVPSFAINDVYDGLQYHDGFWHDLEAIGNIHDNPELLGGNEDG